MGGRLLIGSLVMAVLAGACGGDDGADAATSTTAQPLTTTTSLATTTTKASTTTTTAAPTTTVTTEPPAPSAEEIAGLIVLESGFFGADWEEVPQTESDFEYATIEGCAFLDEMADADGHLVEAESPVFSQLDTEIEHDVRVYADDAAATDVVLAWTVDQALQCLIEGARSQAQEALDSGELAGFTTVDFDALRFDDLVGEPRVTNFEIETTLTGPDAEVVIFVDIYLMQVGRSVSRVEVTNPDALWDGTEQLLAEVANRMTTADQADAS